MSTPKTVLIAALGQDRTKQSLFEHLRSLDIKLVALESPNNVFAQDLKEQGIIDNLLTLDLSSRDTLLDECIDLIDNAGIKLDGVLTFWDDAVGLSVRLSNHYGLPGNDIEAVDVAHDKGMTRERLCALGFASPAHTAVTSEEELRRAAKDMNFPVILKPLYGAASIGVTKVHSLDTIAEEYCRVLAILEDELNSGGLMGLTFGGGMCQDVRTFVIEEFLEGPEYDVDVILFQGEVMYSKAVDNLPLQHPNFCEIMELTPPYRERDVPRITDTAETILRALNFQNGVFHVEIIDDVRLGPILVECNPRMGGGPMRGIHRSLYGVDLAEEALNVCLGQRPQLEHSEEASGKQVVTINLHAIVSGTLREPSRNALAFLDEDPQCQYYVSPNPAGSELVGWHQGYPSKAGRIQLCYENVTPQEAVEKANDVLNTFNHSLAAITDTDEMPPKDFYTSRLTHFADSSVTSSE